MTAANNPGQTPAAQTMKLQKLFWVRMTNYCNTLTAARAGEIYNEMKVRHNARQQLK